MPSTSSQWEAKGSSSEWEPKAAPAPEPEPPEPDAAAVAIDALAKVLEERLSDPKGLQKIGAVIGELAQAIKDKPDAADFARAIAKLKIAPYVDVKPTPVMNVVNVPEPKVTVMPAPEVDTTFDVVIAPAARDGSRRMTITRTSKKPE